MKNKFEQLLRNYCSDESLIQDYWNEIETNYTDSKRHYHNLEHLDNLWLQLNGIKDQIEDWDTILFTLFYHDVIYNALKSDNEEQSAWLAIERMRSLDVPQEMIAKCEVQILATKAHGVADASDCRYFLDADLSVLGLDWETYTAYYENVRKEYSIYPMIVYRRGRKKVLKHFLEMERIFKSAEFYEKFEGMARVNLRKELELLGN